MKGSGAPSSKYTPLPTPTNAKRQMQHKYYIMRWRAFQAMSEDFERMIRCKVF